MESVMLDSTNRLPPALSVTARRVGGQRCAHSREFHSFLAIAAATKSVCRQVVS
jgi:hypothetical protein